MKITDEFTPLHFLEYSDLINDKKSAMQGISPCNECLQAFSFKSHNELDF